MVTIKSPNLKYTKIKMTRQSVHFERVIKQNCGGSSENWHTGSTCVVFSIVLQTRFVCRSVASAEWPATLLLS